MSLTVVNCRYCRWVLGLAGWLAGRQAGKQVAGRPRAAFQQQQQSLVGAASGLIQSVSQFGQSRFGAYSVSQSVQSVSPESGLNVSSVQFSHFSPESESGREARGPRAACQQPHEAVWLPRQAGRQAGRQAIGSLPAAGTACPAACQAACRPARRAVS